MKTPHRIAASFCPVRLRKRTYSKHTAMRSPDSRENPAKRALLGALKIVLGRKRVALYLACAMAFSLFTGMLTDLVF